jgi:hypothetical protein
MCRVHRIEKSHRYAKYLRRLLVFNGSGDELEEFKELPFTNTDVIGVVLPGMEG